MLIVLVGSLGAGAVWGWLLVMVGDNRSGRPRVSTVVSLLLATAFGALNVLWLAGWRSLIFFLLAAALALLVHIAWRVELRRGIRLDSIEEG